MTRFKNNLSIAAAVVTLAFIGTIMNSRQSVVQGAGGPTVTIDPAQLPLHVTGSTTATGTVAATQSGLWNVGITGQPINVNVSSLPSSPIPTIDQFKLASNIVELGAPGFPGFASSVSSILPDGSVVFNFVVPANMNLVITSVQFSPISQGAGTHVVELQRRSQMGSGRELWVVPNTGTTVFQFADGGIVLPAGWDPGIFLGPGSPGNLDVRFHGYLTSH